MVRSLPAYHLRSQGAVGHSLGNIWSIFPIGLKLTQAIPAWPIHPCSFSFWDFFFVVIFGYKKNLRVSYPSYHILGESRLTKPGQKRFIPMNSDPISFFWTQIMQPK